MKKLVYSICIGLSALLFILYYPQIGANFWQRSFTLQPGEEVTIDFPDPADANCAYGVFGSEPETVQALDVIDLSNNMKIAVKTNIPYTPEKALAYFNVENCTHQKQVHISLSSEPKIDIPLVIKNLRRWGPDQSDAMYNLFLLACATFPLLLILAIELISKIGSGFWEALD